MPYARPVSEPQPGEHVAEDVVLVRPLMQGGVGSVWVARHERLRADVAVKLLSGQAPDEISKRRFAREAAAAMEIKSPHVVQMLDYGVRPDGTPFIVMELLAGEDLEGRLGHGRIPARDALSIVKQTGQALHRAHEHGILHRDVKPANVFLMPGDALSGDAYFVKLVDFGFAKRVDRVSAQLTEQGQIVGTPRYMSPEQMMGQELDARSDLYSLGALAFEAFTGQPPFDGATLRQIADAIFHHPAPRLTTVNPALPLEIDAWFARACARDRAARFGSAREMIEALQRVFERPESTASTMPAPAAPTPSEPRVARPTYAGVGRWLAVAALAALALGAWLLGR